MKERKKKTICISVKLKKCYFYKNFEWETKTLNFFHFFRMRFPRSGKTKLRSAPLGNARVDNDWTKNGNPKKRVNSLLTLLLLFLTFLTYILFIDFDSFSIEGLSLSTGKKVSRVSNIVSCRNLKSRKSIN